MQSRLYLCTLEAVSLDVGEVYNPLPPHLTLMSRFWSNLPPEVLADTIRPIFEQTAPIDLIYGESMLLGPKHTPVYMIAHTDELRQLHEWLRGVLDKTGAVYTLPQFIGSGHKPHVSRRDGFTPGKRHVARAAYLIEVIIQNDQHQRFVRAKFDLADSRDVN